LKPHYVKRKAAKLWWRSRQLNGVWFEVSIPRFLLNLFTTATIYGQNRRQIYISWTFSAIKSKIHNCFTKFDLYFIIESLIYIFIYIYIFWLSLVYNQQALAKWILECQCFPCLDRSNARLDLKLTFSIHTCVSMHVGR
jgi:hypothetical protein